jgi:uncharacterized protein (TIGR02271 family)
MAQTQTGTGTLVGYFEDHTEAARAVEALRDAGFTSAHIGVAHWGDSSTSSSTSAAGQKTASATHAVGEKAAGVWDKIKSFFEGDAPEAYADERTRGDLANREITPNPDDDRYSRSGYPVTALSGSLSGMSVPEDRSRYFGHRMGSSERGAVVTVNAGDRANEAQAILVRYGADLGENAATYDYSQPRGEYSQKAEREGTQNNIQLLGEVLRVHKDRINRGEVTLRKEVITETQTVQVPVTREELVIERRAVDDNRPATGNIGEDEEIRIPLSEERPNIDKSTVVREEVAVGKKPVKEVRDVTGEVRREELVVDDQTRKRAS